MQTNFQKKKITILDTDIGCDIDDTWALAMLMKSPELDLKMVMTSYGDTEHRAEIVAKFLAMSGRADVDVAVGIKAYEKPELKRQADWVGNYKLKDYKGKIHYDAVEALIDFIMKSKEIVTLICIGPATNIGAALRKEPGIAEKISFVGMYGSIYWSHRQGNGIIPEYNVVSDIQAAQEVFTANWHDAVITPVDTCGKIRLRDELYAEIKNSCDPVLKILIENYEVWNGHKKLNESSILFDTAAIHLAYSRDFLNIQEMNIKVDDKGYTVIDKTAKSIKCAISWTDLPGYEKDLAKRLLSPLTHQDGGNIHNRRTV